MARVPKELNKGDKLLVIGGHGIQGKTVYWIGEYTSGGGRVCHNTVANSLQDALHDDPSYDIRRLELKLVERYNAQAS